MTSFNTNYKLKEPTMEFYHESKNKGFKLEQWGRRWLENKKLYLNEALNYLQIAQNEDLRTNRTPKDKFQTSTQSFKIRKITQKFQNWVRKSGNILVKIGKCDVFNVICDELIIKRMNGLEFSKRFRGFEGNERVEEWRGVRGERMEWNKGVN